MNVKISKGEYLHRFKVTVTDKVTQLVHEVELHLYTELQHLVMYHLFSVYNPNQYTFSSIKKEWSDDF